MASYQELYNYYATNVADPNTPKGPEWDSQFNQWTDDIQQALGVQGWDAIPVSELGNFVYQGGDVAAQPGATLPLEQGLLLQALPGLMADVTNDANRQAMAQAQQAIAQGDYDLARQLILRATSGQQLQTELGAAGDAATAKTAALQEALTKLSAAQQPLSDARLKEAETAVTGVNLGLERTNDQLTADRALQGFVGGSTMDEAAMSRAAIDARQKAAGLVGAARTANATDTRDIGGFGASQGYSIANALADQRMGLTNADYGRSLAAALSLPQIQNQFVTTQQNIDQQRNAGLARTLGLLNWWSTNSQAPTATYNPVVPDNSGNDLAGLGANLTSAALNIGNASKWWQTPAVKTPATDPNAYSVATGVGPWA